MKLLFDVCGQPDNMLDEKVKLTVREHKVVTAPSGLFTADGDPADWKPLRIYVHDDASKFVGALLGATYWHTLHINWLWVSENLRGRGIGRELLERGLDEARQRGCRTVWGNTWETQGAFAIYEHLGAQLMWRQEFNTVGQALLWYEINLEPSSI